MGWWFLIAGLAATIGLVLCHPRFRDPSAMSDAQAIAAEAYPAAPGEDWPSLWSRLSARKLGERLAPAVAVPAFVLATARWELTLGETYYPVALMLLYTAGSVGAMAGHLVALRRQPTSPTLGSLTPRVLGSYLRPIDLRLGVAAVGASGIASVVGVAAVVAGATRDGWGLVVTGAVAGLLCLAVRPVCARVLESPTRVSTEGGRVWAELVRGLVLRDIHQGLTLFGLVGIFLAAMPLTDELPGSTNPGWLRLAGMALMVGSVGVAVLVSIVSGRTPTLRWTRRHALDEVVA